MEERLEDLKAQSMEVLVRVKPEVREKLIRFARTSSSPTKAEKRALQSTGDADKALACWQLAVVLRDFDEEEFEKHVSDICQKSHRENVSQAETKIKPEEKEMEKRKGPLEIEGYPGTGVEIKDGRTILKFYGPYPAAELCKKLLQELFLGDVDWEVEEYLTRPIRALIIQILEEKFGLKIKTCMKCGYFLDTLSPYLIVGEGVRNDYFKCEYRGRYIVPPEEKSFRLRPEATDCKYWKPKN